MTSDQVADDLVKARGLIDTPEKWAKSAGDGRTCWCASTACKAVAREGGFNVDFLRWQLAVAALEEALPDPFEDLPEFNDAPSTSHADILALFDRAIASRRALSPDSGGGE